MSGLVTNRSRRIGRTIIKMSAAILFSAAATLPLLAVAADSNSTAASPQQLVALTIANELEHGVANIHLTYVVSERDGNKTRTKRVVETANGDIALTVTEDGRPLSPEKLRDEKQHVLKLVNDPAAWTAHRKREQRDDMEEQALLRSIPDAFVFEYAGTRSAAEGQVVTLRFSPNPHFSPPSRETQVFLGMRGVMEIGLPAARIVRIEGTLFQPVNFGWGILGRLNSGGRFLIEQAPVGKERWEVTHTQLRFTGKVLLVKDLNIDEESWSMNYQAAPSLTLAEAVAFAVQFDGVGQNAAPEVWSTLTSRSR